MHTTGSSIVVKSGKGKGNSLAEVSNVERQLWTYVQSKGLLSTDVRNLYRKACGLYEKIFLGNNELEELQETEYSLWKLHYKQIDEFRRQTSKNPESVQEGFKLYLEESSGFYQDLISKFKRHYGFQDPTLFYHNQPAGSISGSIEHSKLHKCRLVCHRLLVRLGDLARYLEVNQNHGIRQMNWSAVAKCYFEAAKMYPDGGNPQNQLALLATPTYIGDEFLALYHCVRSIAVKEPFPDASDNLLFIFERNMSVHIHSLSVGSRYNFLKPSERVMTSVQKEASNGALDFWSLFVRLTSFFFLELSLESFSYTFASTIRELEALLALDDAKLSLALEAYQNVNISRPGPYRALQVVSVLIFTFHNLMRNPEPCLEKLRMALTVTFICIGRVVERCFKENSTDDHFPLLPTVMVFSEWLVEVLERVEKCEIDENLTSAMSYFFSSYVKLLNHLLEVEGKNHVNSPNLVALWEDYELRGFIPVSRCHSSLDFSTHWKNEATYRAKNECRIHRIIQAAIKIAKRSTNGTQSWIFYEKGGNFCTQEAKESIHTKTDAEEDEDIIVFKPIERHNSAPIKQLVTDDESLRYASSLLIAQNRALISSLSSSGGRPGPPSLSAWVLNETATDNLTKEASTSTHYNYCPPTPSAPLLPEDATWLFNQSVPPPPPPPWPRLLRGRQNNNMMREASSQAPVPAVYTESTVSMRPFVNGQCDQRRENALFDHHCMGYERTKGHVFGSRMDAGADQQHLLQYLKEKEWRIQQEAKIAHYTNTRS